MKHHVSLASLISLASLASLTLVLGLGFAACGSKAAPGPTGPSGDSDDDDTAGSPSEQLAAQVERGKQLYGAECAGCHGDGGEGTDKGPPVVGAEAFPLHPRDESKRDVDFHTAADVFAWATVHMPGDAPGSLSTDEYLAIFAFDLTANGVALTAPLDGAAAEAIVLHPHEATDEE